MQASTTLATFFTELMALTTMLILLNVFLNHGE